MWRKTVGTKCVNQGTVTLSYFPQLYHDCSFSNQCMVYMQVCGRFYLPFPWEQYFFHGYAVVAAEDKKPYPEK